MKKLIAIVLLLVGCDNTPGYPPVRTITPDGGVDGGSNKSEPKHPRNDDDMLWWLLMMG